jgi:cytochrome P450
VLITKIPRDNSTVDLQTLFFKLTLDSATEFLFGESVGSLNSRAGSEQERFGTAFDFAQSRLPSRSRLGPLVYLFGDRSFDEACVTVHRFVDQIVAKALTAAELFDEEKQDDRYVFSTEMAKATRDPRQLRDELLNILLAGRDTTASLLSNTFHVLARRPDIWQKLVAEVEELGGRKPDFETLKGMKYLKNVLTECTFPFLPLLVITE